MHKAIQSDQPLISIIVPSYNQGKFIRETIESCLIQDYRPIEVIIVDGASTDSTLEILHEYDNTPEILWISEPDSGPIEAVNKGFNLAKGEIAGIQSSDDAYLQGSFSQVVREFLNSPDFGIIYGDVIYVDSEGNEIRRTNYAPFSIQDFLCKNSEILQPSAFFNLDLAKKLGGWKEEYYNADIEMWLRMVFMAKAKKINQFWGLRHVHDGQRNMQSDKIVKCYYSMIKQSEDIAKANDNIKKAANAGKYIVVASYKPIGSLSARYQYLRALLTYPKLAQNEKFLGYFIPRYWEFKRFKKSIRRILKKYVFMAKREI